MIMQIIQKLLTALIQRLIPPVQTTQAAGDIVLFYAVILIPFWTLLGVV